MHPQAYLLRSWCNYRLQRPNEALNDIKKYIRIETQDASGYYLRGLIQYDQKNYPSAYNSMNHAVRRDPNMGRAHGYLGNISFKEKNIEIACEHWQKAVDLGIASFQAYVRDECW